MNATKLRRCGKHAKWAMLACWAVVMVTPAVLKASSVVPMTVQTLADEAGQVIIGEVVSVRSYWTENPRNIESEITFRNVEYLKGILPGAGEDFTLIVPGGTIGTITMRVSDTPDFAAGEKWLLFLLPTYKVFPVAGLSQGAFRIEADEAGVERIHDAARQLVSGLDKEGFIQIAPKPKPDARAHLVSANGIRLKDPTPTDPAKDHPTATAAITLQDFRAALQPILTASKSHNLTQPAGRPIRGDFKAVPLQLAPASQGGAAPPVKPSDAGGAPPAAGVQRARPIAATEKKEAQQ